ncbi:hypothetical protein PoB_000646100 [Plakobranchus ocellatus]|uniref:Uncharacterized protein n=1 Tax=Plakobranchus ocellatus TaxID=259542 RepID=A0AAV3XYD0_9GAST|nr:hypothetical protein PoB_000646100 [Plakobranchus ocellatus]
MPGIVRSRRKQRKHGMVVYDTGTEEELQLVQQIPKNPISIAVSATYGYTRSAKLWRTVQCRMSCNATQSLKRFDCKLQLVQQIPKTPSRSLLVPPTATQDQLSYGVLCSVGCLVTQRSPSNVSTFKLLRLKMITKIPAPKLPAKTECDMLYYMNHHYIGTNTS